MSKICPLSMAGEPTECYKEECNGYINGECYLNRQTLSQYYTSKNLDDMKYSIEGMTQDDLR